MFPDRFFMNRGNHEDVDIARMYGFWGQGLAVAEKLIGENGARLCADFFDTGVADLFASMPYCSCVGGKIFVCQFRVG